VSPGTGGGAWTRPARVRHVMREERHGPTLDKSVGAAPEVQTPTPSWRSPSAKSEEPVARSRVGRRGNREEGGAR
jgi:hypothetical protein